MKLLQDPSIPGDLKSVLKLLTALYGATSLEKHLSVLVEGGYFQSKSSASLHEAIELMCERIKPEAVALVDAIAPSDFALNSALGHSDGQVYRHLEESMTPGLKKRPDWWQLILQPQLKISHL